MRRWRLLRRLGWNSTYSSTRAWCRQLGRLVAIALTFTLCASATAATGVLTWVAPSQNTDGSPLTDLAGYRAHYGCGSESGYPNTREFPASATSGAIEDLPDGAECRFVLVAVNAAGVQSAYSNEARKTFPGLPPADPVEIPAIEWRAAAQSQLKMASVRQAQAWQGYGTPQVTFASPVGGGNTVVVVFPNVQDYHPFGPDIPTDDQSGVYTEDFESADLLNSNGETVRVWVFSRRNITDGAQTITAPWADGQPHLGQAFFFELEGIDNGAAPSDTHFSTIGSSSTSSSIPLTAGAANAVAIGCALWPDVNGGASGSSGTTLFDDDNYSAGLYKALSSSGSNSLDFSWANSRRVQQFGIVYEPAGGGGDDGDITASASVDSVFAATATVSASLSAGITADSALSGRASVLGAITEAIAAGDADSAAQAALRALTAQVSTDAQYAAIAQAAAAIQAGLEAGEQWAAVAAAEAGLTAGVELGASFVSLEGAFTAALEAGTEAAAQFLGAVAAFGLLEAGASAADAFAASARISASISDATQFGASFTTASLNDAAISAATSLQDAFASEAAAIANLSAQASVHDAYSAISVALAAINIGAVLDATFSATSSADASVVGATASVRAIRRMSATVRAIRPTATVN